MSIVKKVLVTLVLVLLNSVPIYCTKYKCEIPYLGRCNINELKLTEDNYDIEPKAENLIAVTTIWLSGTVPILSSERICEAMPNLELFYGHSVSMKKIKGNAFQGCKNLMILHLYSNNFIKIDRNAFQGLTNLKSLTLRGGNVPVLDLDLTNSKYLTALELANLKITAISADILRELTHLEVLRLDSNKLFDLDVEEILKYSPKLEEISLADNNFKCTRLHDILAVLKRKNITANAFADDQRYRYYTPEKIDGIHCFTDQQWESELSTLPVEQQLIYNNTETETDEKEWITDVTYFTTKLDELQKKQDTQISDERIGALVKDVRPQDKQILNLVGNLNNRLESLDKQVAILRATQGTLNERLEMLDKKLEDHHAAQ